MEIWIGFIPIEFSQYHRPFSDQLFLLEQRIANGVLHEMHRRHQAVRSNRHEVVHDFIAGRAIPAASQFSETLEVSLLGWNGAIGLEEHVLVQVREAVVLRSFGEATVLHYELDVHDRHGVILDDDHLQSVRQFLAMDRQV